MNSHNTRDGGTDTRKCRNCGQPRGQHAAITSGINDEYWCPNASGKGFRENRENISENIFWSEPSKCEFLDETSSARCKLWLGHDGDHDYRVNGPNTLT